MSDFHNASLDHLAQASDFEPGTPEQAYHLHAANTLATLANADAAHRHAAAVENLGQINAQMMQLFAAPVPDATEAQQMGVEQS